MESSSTLSPTSFLSAGRVSPFTDDISTRVEPGLSLVATSFATLSVLSIGTAITVTSHPLTASAFVLNDASSLRPTRLLPSAGVGPPHGVALLEEVAHEERPHPPRRAEDGDLQLSSSPIFLTPAVRSPEAGRAIS